MLQALTLNTDYVNVFLKRKFLPEVCMLYLYYLSLMWCGVSLCSVWCMYVSCLFLYPPLMKHGLLEDTLFSSVIFLFESPMKLVDFPACHVWWTRRVNYIKSHSKSHKATIFRWFFYAFPRIFVIFPRSQGPWSTSDLTMSVMSGLSALALGQRDETPELSVKLNHVWVTQDSISMMLMMNFQYF